MLTEFYRVLFIEDLDRKFPKLSILNTVGQEILESLLAYTIGGWLYRYSVEYSLAEITLTSPNPRAAAGEET